MLSNEWIKSNFLFDEMTEKGSSHSLMIKSEKHMSKAMRDVKLNQLLGIKK